MIDTSKSLIYNGSKKVDKIYHGTSSSPVYTWEVGEVVTGPVETKRQESINLYDPEKFPWDLELSSEYQPEKIQPKAISNIVNGKALGQAWGHFTEVVQEGIPRYFTKGTMDIGKPPFLYVGQSEIEYGTVDESAGFAFDVYETRIMLNIRGYKWPTSSRVVMTFRERAASGTIAIALLRVKSRAGNEYEIRGMMKTDTDDVNSQGHQLRGVSFQIDNYVGDTEYNFIEDLHLPAMNGEIYDLKVYLEHGEIAEMTMTRNRNGSSINIYFPSINFDSISSDDMDYLTSITVTRVEFVDGSSISGNFPVRAIGTNAITRYYRIDLPDTIYNLNPSISSYDINRGRELKITYIE